MTRLSKKLLVPAVFAATAILTTLPNRPALSVALPLANPVPASHYTIEIQSPQPRITFKRRSRAVDLSKLLDMKREHQFSIEQPVAGPNDKLFGTIEIRSNKFKPFTKWNSAVQKMDREEANLAAFKRKFKPWLGYFDSLKKKDGMEQLAAINSFMNRSRYVRDIINWGVPDYWESPGEFLAKFGDCEDYAIAKYMALKYLGWKIDQLRVVAVKDMNLRVGHAILAVYYEKKIFILDNQIKVVVDSRRIHHYKPVFSINEHHWWLHRHRV